MRCRLLLPTIPVSVSLSVCLSRGSTLLYCAKMAERIKMLFGVNTPVGPIEHCVTRGPDPPTERGRRTILNTGTSFGHALGRSSIPARARGFHVG